MYVVVIPDSQERRIAMFKDNKLRLLMTLAGFERLGIDDEPDTTWIIPSKTSARELHESQEIIEKHRNNPTWEYGDEDPMTAEEMLRRAPTVKPSRAEYDDDSEGDSIVSNEDFRPGGPTESNKKAAALKELKKKRRKRESTASEIDDRELSDDVRDARRQAGLLVDRGKKGKMKSKFFIRGSDDESNEELDMEFFAGEEAIRRKQAEKALEVLVTGRPSAGVNSKKRKSKTHDEGRRKRTKSTPALSDSEDIGIADEASSSSSPHLQRSLSSGADPASTPRSSPKVNSSQENGMQDAMMEVTRDSSQERVTSKASGLTLNKERNTDGGSEDEDEDEDRDDVPVAPTRRRARVARLDDSDEE